MKKCERCGTNFDSTINMCPNCGSTMVVEISDIETLNTESAEQIPATVKPVEKEEENNIIEVPAEVDHYDRKNKFALLRSSQIFWSMVLMDVPLLGLITCIIWSTGIGVKAQRKEMARAYLTRKLVIFVILLLVIVIYRWGFRLTLNDLPGIISKVYDRLWHFVAGLFAK